jgi:hypothetical protein
MQEIIALSCRSRKFPVNLGQDGAADKEPWAWPPEFFLPRRAGGSAEIPAKAQGFAENVISVLLEISRCRR